MGDPHCEHWLHSSTCADAVVRRPTLSAVSVKQLSLTKNKGEGKGRTKMGFVFFINADHFGDLIYRAACKTSFLFEVTEHLTGRAGFSLSFRPSYTLG